MKLTPGLMRAVAVAGIATIAPLLAAMPAHAGVGIQGPAAATADMPPCEDGRGCEDAVLTLRKAGGVKDPFVAEWPPGPNADIIAI